MSIKFCILSIINTFCIVVFPLNGLAEQSVMVHDDFGKGIKSNVFISLGDTSEAKGITDDTGLLRLEKPCAKGKQIKASPLHPLYYEGLVDCRPSQTHLVIKVTKKAFTQNLIWNAEMFEESGSFGNAALVYTELATRLHNLEPEGANVSRNKAYSAFAVAIETPGNVRIVEFDENQGMTVLSTEFVIFLKEYQRQKGLPITGAIDFKTLSTQSDISIGEVLLNRVGSMPSENMNK